MQNIENKCDCFPHGEIQTERGTIRINFLEYKELVHSGVCAHLGDVLDLGEPEGHAEAAEEDGDERAAVAEGREAELPHRRRPSRERRLHPHLVAAKNGNSMENSGWCKPRASSPSMLEGVGGRAAWDPAAARVRGRAYRLGSKPRSGALCAEGVRWISPPAGTGPITRIFFLLGR